jgi:formiminotetrahydrofolate cyclodeaminase
MQRRVVAGQEVEAWLDLLAAETPETGASAAAALVAACGAALVASVARRTARRAPDAAERLDVVAREADEARSVVLGLADRDAAAYHRTLEAYRLPQDSDDDRRERLRALQAALQELLEIQLDLARRSAYLLGLAEEVTADADANAVADGLGAAAALYAATLASVANAEVNAFAILDEERREELRATCRALTERAGTILEGTQARFRARLSE